jgi:hypothetical protein
VRAVSASWIALQIGIGTAVAAQSPTAPVLRGRVIDARTAAPLRDVGVTVTVGSDTVARGVTDTSGAFQMPTKSGSLIVHFVRLGFRRDSIAASVGEFPLRVAMVPATATIASTLGPVIVRDSAAKTAFERRAQRRNGGAFIRAEDIAKRKPYRTSDLFRSYPGVRIDDSSGVTQLVSLRGTRQSPDNGRNVVLGRDTLRTPASNGQKCVLRVGMEGHLMPVDFSVDDVRPDDVMGIEIYLGAATLPVEFSSVQKDAPCGLVMVWTKTSSKP